MGKLDLRSLQSRVSDRNLFTKRSYEAMGLSIIVEIQFS